MRWTRQRRARDRSQGGFAVSDGETRWTNGAVSRFANASAVVHTWLKPPGDNRSAYGEAVWSWHPLLVSSQRRWSWPNRVRVRLQSAGDGGKRNSSPRRARNKPLKPLRRERRVISGEPVVTPCAFFLHTGHGCIGHPALPAPSEFHEGKVTGTTRANDAARTRRCVRVSPPSSFPGAQLRT